VGNDLGNDLGTLEAWADADADRHHAYFGDDFAESMVAQGAACQFYLSDGLGVDLLSGDVGPQIDNQSAATIKPTGNGSGAFVGDFVAYGGCLVINDFDEIGAFGVGPTVTHGFTTPWGTQYSPPVAGSVEWRRTDGNGNTKHTIVFPYDLGFVFPTYGGPYPGISARAVLLQEVLYSWGRPSSIPDPATDDPPARFSVAQNYPNPFNPRTTIRFSLSAREQVSVRVYNLRGELVATLQDGVMDAGPQSVTWAGKDDAGHEVSSGVYLYKVNTADQQVVKKMALLK
jgi:hypothetical protein